MELKLSSPPVNSGRDQGGGALCGLRQVGQPPFPLVGSRDGDNSVYLLRWPRGLIGCVRLSEQFHRLLWSPLCP